MNLTRSFLSNLETTTNGIGSFAGSKVPSLQIDHLEPGEYTIQFQVVEPPIDNLNFGLCAYIYWKVDGQTIDRLISVFSGAAISGVAEAVHVYFLDQSARGAGSNILPAATVTNGSPIVTFATSVTLAPGQTIVFGPGQSYQVATGVVNGNSITLTQLYTGSSGSVSCFSLASYKVGAALSKGTRPTTMQPPTLFTQIPVTVDPNSGSSFFQIPQDAGIISALVNAFNLNTSAQSESLNTLVQFWDITQTIMLGCFPPNYFNGWYPVPVGSYYIQLINTSATVTLGFTLQWGIEG